MKYTLSFYILIFLFSCSTEKNTIVSRTYHGTTAKYNGYFNANELLTQALTAYKNSRKEDFYSILPINPLPNDQEVESMYPAIDTALVKLTKVISKHSMPTASEPSKKRTEYNPWIDENWMLIGISNYYRKDYELANKNFVYVNKFFSNDPSNYLAAIWTAKTFIETKKYTEAALILKELDKKIADLEGANSSKFKLFNFLKKKEKTSNKKKSKRKIALSKKEEEKAEFPKKSRFLFELTKADLSLRQENYDQAILDLEKALTFCKKSKDKARIHYILAQLNQHKKQNDQAKYHFTKVLRYQSSFEMNFNARINRALMGGDFKIKQELQKMLRDDKNLEFKDQIYYALAEIEFKEGNKTKSIELYHKAIIFSVKNTRQKAICYEKLGDMNFADRNYISAQKYYDSCAKVMPENYPNGFVIKNKATKLKDLVLAVETAQFEDSVQRIASMSESERVSFAENLIKKIQADEKRKKEEAAIRLKELQAQQASINQNESQTKFFWNNPKMKSQGLEDFKKLWGSRENEDDWRRSDKIAIANFKEFEVDSIDTLNPVIRPVNDSLTVESLLANLPINDSLLSVSNEKLSAALYDAGIIYKDQLNELAFAEKQFNLVIAMNYESNYKLLALFQLYKIYEISDPTKAYTYKSQILSLYPSSDFANYLKDPEYFIKKKEFDKLSESDYVKALERYNRGLYTLVISTAQSVIENEKTNPYRSKYMLLQAMSIGQTTENKSKIIPILKQVIVEYPGTVEELKAKELIEVFEKGYSEFKESNFKNNSIYKYNDEAEHWVIIFLDEKENSSISKTKVADFNKEYFSKEKLNTSTKIYGNNQSVVLIKSFTDVKAKEYVRTFKKTKKHIQNLQGSKMFLITQENLKILFETQKLQDYELFYTEFY
jgi:tetratricopeptide (TPR) repeat protein